VRTFEYAEPKTLDEARAALKRTGAQIIAGGTDLLGVLKDDILPEYPSTLVDLKTIPGLDYIEESADLLKIGAMTRLADIAAEPVVKHRYAALAEAAARVGSPQIREMGTIGGNLCQLSRCWYFRVAGNRFDCLRKGGRGCPAALGDSRYHSIFGRSRGCSGVNPSDLAPVMVALDASVKTTARVVPAEAFFQAGLERGTVLQPGEIVTEIQIPAPAAGSRSAFTKYALRRSIDFPIVNCAVALDGTSARICLNAVYGTPYRAIEAERLIAGRPIDEDLAEAAGEAAIAGAQALDSNRFKVQIAKTMVKRAILACG
jgi:xanthine dehydrogenase YagS FAD-binding subunit